MDKKETTVQRPKSPKSKNSAVSMASHVSGNNNVSNPAAKNKSPAPAPLQSMTPQERSKIARDKFQNLLISANKVQEQKSQLGIIIKPSSVLGTAAQMHAAAVLAQMSANVSAAAAAISLQTPPTTTSAPQSMTQPTLQPQNNSASNQNSGNGQIQNASIMNSIYPASTTVRATTISTSAKANFPRNNPNLFPNIDPRTFPKPLSQSNPVQLNPIQPHSIMKPNTTKSMLGMDRSKNLRAFVEKAIAEHKVFSCVGVYPAIKNALKKRGWVEKTGPINIIRSASVPFRPSESTGEDETDAAWIARNLRDYPPDFIWVIRRDNIDWKSMGKDQMINRYPKAWFTTKVGLSACLQQIHWFSEAGFSETFFPRCYRLCMDDERSAFQEDYRLTACMSYCRYFVESYESKGPNWLIDPQSRITPLSIDFASRQLGNYIRMRRHEDIDWLLPPNFMSQHWEAFIHQYVMVVHEKKKIRFESLEGVQMKYDIAKKTLQRISQYWPQSHLDGVYNMWICKPGARSRGKGIVIMNSIEKIMDLLNHGNSREANWVVQKYMERPMLVYKTKFDIRQWFIITDWSPLTVWFYKESYIRFCTKPFVLEDFHESIHLCNNAIQCRYTNAESRSELLPDENMWDNYTFQAYLKTIGKMDQWTKIYSGMKQAIIGVLLASQENIEARKGCFELYGADFMLSEDFTPWLIEINSCPCMASTTSITARMCAQCLEDSIKVVIDRRINRNADTGMFEMVYRQPLSAVTVQQFTGHDLVIQGKKLTRDIDWPGTLSSKTSQVKRASFITNNLMNKTAPVMVAPQENLTFSDLLQKLRMKNTQLFQGYITNTQNQTLAALAGETPDRSLTGTLLSKMRALNKVNKQDDTPENQIIPGMKKVYPISKPSSSKSAKDASDGTLSHLSKYFEEGSNTFANLVRIGKEISDDEKYGMIQSDKELSLGAGGTSGSSGRPETFGPNLRRPSVIGGNPYLPRPETAKTLEEVQIAVNAASNKYGKVTTSSSINDTAETDNNHNGVTPRAAILADLMSTTSLLLDNDVNSITTNVEIPSSPSDSGIDSSETGISSGQEVEEKLESFPKCDEGEVAINKLGTSDADPLPDDGTILIPIPEPTLSPIPTVEKANSVETFPSSSNANLNDVSPNKLVPEKPDHLLIDLSCTLEGNFHFQIQDILNNNLQGFPSSTSTSPSNSDSDCDTCPPHILKYNPSLFLSPPRSRTVNNSGGESNGLTSLRDRNFNSTPFHQSSLPKQRSKGVKVRSKYPCHRLSLRPSSSSVVSSSKKSLPTFPLSKINLKLV